MELTCITVWPDSADRARPPVASSAADAWSLRASGLGGTAVVVVAADGTALGVVDDDALLGIPEEARPVTPVMAAVRRQPAGWVVDAEPDAAVTPVVETMQTLQVGAVPVRPRSGRIEGIVLAGDLYHYPEERTTGKTPSFEFNVPQSKASRNRVEIFLRQTGAQLWIEHDIATHANLPKAPKYVE